MATRTLTKPNVKVMEKVQEAVTTGPAAAAMISGGIGAFVIGLGTTLAEASEVIKNGLNWMKPVGPLSGKTVVGILIWLISWFVLNRIMKDKNSNLVAAFTITIILIVSGLLLTFPPFFEMFAAE